MKINLLVVLAFLSSCSAPKKGMLLLRNGDSVVVKKMKSDGVEPLLFRRDNGTVTTLSLKKIASLKVVSSETKTFAGDSWVSVEIVHKKDESNTVYRGWIRKQQTFTGKTVEGMLSTSIDDIASVDFIMEEAPAPEGQ